VPDLRRAIDPIRDVRAFRQISRLIRERRPTIVHTHMAKAGALGRLAARKGRVPAIVHTFHGHVLEGYFSGPVNRAVLGAERGLARITDALIAVSPAVRDELLALRVGRPSQWRVIPIGLDLAPLLTLEPDPMSARRLLGLPEEGPVIGIVGRLAPIKDYATFLSAAARVAREVPDATFAVVGDGELRDPLESRARALLGERCRFTGWVMDLPNLYAALDVVVLTSRNEGTPVALIEAGAAGKPVVATRVGGVPDVVLEGQTGLLAPSRDPEAIAGQVLRLLRDPSEAGGLGTAAREWVRGRFSIDRLADDLAALYRELLDRKMGRSVG
jgi:glycosyltransferase involved in cell wall biosynthesis